MKNVLLSRRLARALLLSVLAAPMVFAQDKPPPTTPRQLSLENQPRRGDFDDMLKRRVIRVLLPYSRTLFFVEKGHEKGISAENLRDFERYLNTKHAKELGKRPITVILIPTTRDKLMTGVSEGIGDIAAGNLTVTEERRRIVDFAVATGREPVREWVVSGPKAPEVRTLDDLAGKTVHVRPSSSYAESLASLSERLKAAGKTPVRLAALPDALEDEDALEMLNAGLFQFIVVDDWKGRIWAQVLPNVKLRDDLILRDSGVIGWAIRKNSPRLEAEIADFYAKYTKKQRVLDARLVQYFQRVKQISDNTGDADVKRFTAAIGLFTKYGDRYRFDPLMLAAQGYQESKLRQDARSNVGAIGIMQVMPATGEELHVGDIRSIEPNIHAGTKYMDRLMTRYFADANFSDTDRSLFAFASYNAGPGAIARMRSEAARRGLDQDKWFNNVEVVTAERIGLETTTYVRNIYKYYVAYRLLAEARAAATAGRERAASAATK